MMDLRALRYFVAVCSAGGFAKAAARINIAQSAVSAQVAQLEENLGVKLLLRRARGVERTEAGDRLYSFATAMLASLERAELDVRSLATAVHGRVAIGLVSTAVEAIGMNILTRLHEALPQAEQRVLEGHSEDILQQLATGDLDIGLSYLEPGDDRLQAIPLIDEELVCVGRPDLIGGEGPIAFEDLLRLPLVLPGRLVVLRALASDPALRARLAGLKSIEVEGAFMLKRAVLAGLGCAIQSGATVTDEVASGALVARRIVEPNMPRTLYLVTARARMAVRVVQEARREVVGVVRQVHAAERWPGTLHKCNI